MLANSFAFSLCLVPTLGFVVLFLPIYLVLSLFLIGLPTLLVPVIVVSAFCIHRFLVGIWIGYFQSSILNSLSAPNQVNRRSWMKVTGYGVLLGEGVAFFSCFILFSICFILFSLLDKYNSNFGENSILALGVYGIVIVLSAMTGAFVGGLIQNKVLRKAFYNTHYWPIFSAFGTGASILVFIVNFKNFFPKNVPLEDLVLRFNVILITAAIAGVIYGLVTGFALIYLLKPKPATLEGA
jgi:hypothetical protein